MAELTVAQLIGQNIRQRRDHLGMTAAELGAKVGEAFGKSWPRQTVYLMESGERAMVAAEVAVLAVVLGVPVAKLFEPPGVADTVLAGSAVIPRETLSASGSPELDAVASTMRDLEQTNFELVNLADEQSKLIRDARNGLSGLSASTQDLLDERAADEAGDWHAQMQSETEQGK